MHRILAMLLSSTLIATSLAAAGEPSRPTPIWIDTDIGSTADDPFALALAIASRDAELIGVSTVAPQAKERAHIALRMLHAAGKTNVPVALGGDGMNAGELTGQYQYYYHPAVLYNRAGKPHDRDAVALMHEKLRERPGEITIVALGPLTNIARLLDEHPDAKEQVKRIVVMGGSIRKDYEGDDRPIAEWNIAADVAAARKVFSAGVPLTIVPLDATWNATIDAERRARLFERKSMLTMQVEALYQMAQQATPVLHDVIALSAALDDSCCTWKAMHLKVENDGKLQPLPNARPNAHVATKADVATVLDRCVERMRGFAEPSLPRKLENRTKLLENDTRFPAQVHVFEDYETDIEKRWWLAGRLEQDTANAESQRAFRSHLTLDFDDLQGQLDTMYSAVVFNPVPGPPMGPRTRLRFRYRLEGTSELRVQIYSLSNGYHRYLSLGDLPQGEWHEATVDMTQARRPDGSGGPLSQDERIDDIQFYVDPRATVWIDDIVLYDAPSDDETRPWPQRFHFTGWFDTGKQGVEWPGKFEMAPHEPPRTWKYAKSVAVDDAKSEQLMVHLRGPRPLGSKVELQFDYRCEGASDDAQVVLRDAQSQWQSATTLTPQADGKWHETTLSFEFDNRDRTADELRFELPKRMSLSIDNVLLYTPRVGATD